MTQMCIDKPGIDSNLSFVHFIAVLWQHLQGPRSDWCLGLFWWIQSNLRGGPVSGGRAGMGPEVGGSPVAFMLSTAEV